MPRAIIKEQPHYPFKTELEVRVGDLNYGAHLGYDRLLGLAHQARLIMFDELGASEIDLGDGQTGIVAADLSITYQGEGFRGDVLTFEIVPTEIGLGSFRLNHRIRCGERKVALLEIGFAAFDYERRRPTRLPDAFRERLAALGGADG